VSPAPHWRRRGIALTNFLERLKVKFEEFAFHALEWISQAGCLLRYQRTVSPIASLSGVACLPNACSNLE
jgi:hypothetical protein